MFCLIKVSRWSVETFFMGRSVPTWRQRIEYELDRMQPFRRALSSSEKILFDEMINSVRQRRSSGGLLPSHDIMLPIILSLFLDAWSRISILEEQMIQLRSIIDGEQCD